jgi:chromosome segregation ATPase
LSGLGKEKSEGQKKLDSLETEVEILKTENDRLRHKVAELQAVKIAMEKENFSERFYQADRENKTLREANYKMNTQLTREYSEIQALKDENFEVKSENKEQKDTIQQLNKFLKETKDELDKKNMAVFALEKEIKSMELDFKKLENFSKGGFAFLNQSSNIYLNCLH